MVLVLSNFMSLVKIQHKLTTNDNNVRAHLCPNKFSHQKNFHYNERARKILYNLQNSKRNISKMFTEIRDKINANKTCEKFELMSGAIIKSFFAYGMAKKVTTSLGTSDRTQL